MNENHSAYLSVLHAFNVTSKLKPQSSVER